MEIKYKHLTQPLRHLNLTDEGQSTVVLLHLCISWGKTNVYEHIGVLDSASWPDLSAM